MGHTFAEKALARSAGLPSVQPGQVIDSFPDLVLSHDNTAAIIATWRKLGQVRVKHPDRLVVVLDHAAPAPTTQHAQNHAEIRQFVAEQGIRHFFDVGRGICHQVLSEEGLALPGMVVLGADSHSTHYGALGAFGAGVGRSEVAALWATGYLWLRVPESIKITVHGALDEWASAKDLALHIVGQLGAEGGSYASVEFHGPTIAALSMESRFVLPNLMAEMGVKNAWIAPDHVTLAWIKASERRSPELVRARPQQVEDSTFPRRSPELVRACPQQVEDSTFPRRSPELVRACPQQVEDSSPSANLFSEEMEARFLERVIYPDPDAVYTAQHIFDVSGMEPQIACPHAVDNVAPISKVAGVHIHQAFLGTCTNARLEDLAVAARVLSGRRVHPGARLLVIPASSRVLRQAMRLGYIETLLAAGAALGTPGCGPCMGNHLGVPAPGEVTISTANRNFRGRMGTRDAEIYLANPAVVAASAVAGEIIHPANLW